MLGVAVDRDSLVSILSVNETVILGGHLAAMNPKRRSILTALGGLVRNELGVYHNNRMTRLAIQKGVNVYNSVGSPNSPFQGLYYQSPSWYLVVQMATAVLPLQRWLP